MEHDLKKDGEYSGRSNMQEGKAGGGGNCGDSRLVLTTILRLAKGELPTAIQGRKSQINY
jgi:hypothetical protein